jgi:hypothetical protein
MIREGMKLYIEQVNTSNKTKKNNESTSPCVHRQVTKISTNIMRNYNCKPDTLCKLPVLNLVNPNSIDITVR